MSRTILVIDLHLVLRQQNQILMGLRKNTGFCDGMFHLPAGHLETGETFLQGMVREAKEELSIEITEKDLCLVHVMHHNTGRLALFFETSKWRGCITNHEPEKCETLSRLSLDSLPENVVYCARGPEDDHGRAAHRNLWLELGARWFSPSAADWYILNQDVAVPSLLCDLAQAA